ncbi:hypothetical protein M419DRAFT_11423 [Trichoderma reesei RUT C-30]|uniref:Uncharacterized protein n=1 Tax=Hypocrea jecorina (strain ATCC 56765 / BCRC 32924 / NRRL 11460 / Rut C-30) TaxID=1344414 RepID=A0A024S3E5_HYPJR|nr:hypothetical protein M419DRAFT_11423 [Trichoderma reesei RUT C-30]
MLSSSNCETPSSILLNTSSILLNTSSILLNTSSILLNTSSILLNTNSKLSSSKIMALTAMRVTSVAQTPMQCKTRLSRRCSRIIRYPHQDKLNNTVCRAIAGSITSHRLCCPTGRLRSYLTHIIRTRRRRRRCRLVRFPRPFKVLEDPKAVKDRVMCIQALSLRWSVSLTAARACQSKCCRIPACTMCKRNRILEIPI